MSIKTANIGEIKTHFSAYLKGVKSGGKVFVTERNKRVAKLVPLDDEDKYESEEDRLVAEGILSPPLSDKPLPESFWKAKLPHVRGNLAIELLRQERDED